MANRWRTRHSVITGAGLTVGAFVGISSPALGANYLVTNTYDPGNGVCDVDCTLREALNAANGNFEGDKIYFQTGLTGTITLDNASGALPITGAVQVYGPGPDQLTISGAHNSRIFNVNPATPGDLVYLYGLNMVDGYAVLNGGAIRDEDATLVVIDSILSGNSAAGNGGAIYEAGGYDFGFDTRVVLSTIEGNTAGNYGGGIAGGESFGIVRASTLTGNGATYGGAGRTYYKSSLIDSTVSGNTATGDGAGVYGVDEIGLYNTIAANNTGGTHPDVRVGSTYEVYSDYSLIENTGGATVTGGHNLTGIDPQLGGLASNGGNTPTMKPAKTSPVVDAGKQYGPSDQRLIDRPIDIASVPNVADGNDIGAVELQESDFVVPPPPSGGGTTTPPPTSIPKKKKCKKKHRSSAQIAKKCKKKRK